VPSGDRGTPVHFDVSLQEYMKRIFDKIESALTVHTSPVFPKALKSESRSCKKRNWTPGGA
jgi:hypothetical protein